MSAKREEIVVIGGGLGGCLTALMLAKDPQYHVTLVEAQSTLLNGASRIAARLHLGGEYPTPEGEETALDCVRSAISWKLAMPTDIYTPAPRMKFLISKKTQENGRKGKKKDGLTFEEYAESYEKIRVEYEKEFKRVQAALHWSEEETEKALFGSYKKGKFFRLLEREEYRDYDADPKHSQIAGGFQTPEMGLNPKYLGMIEKMIRAQKNITVLTGHKVDAPIEGEKGNFSIRCKVGKSHETLKASQVLQAVARNGPEITPLDEDKSINVHKRVMLLVDLPSRWKTPPAFIMLGNQGGMLAPYNDKVALCYLPGVQTAYLKDCKLDHENSALPKDWDQWPAEEKKSWAENYFTLAKKRFPTLHEATNPRLLIGDTLNFFQREGHVDGQDDDHENKLKRRTYVKPAEAMGMSMGMSLQQVQQTKQIQAQVHEYDPSVMEVHGREGLFTLYPTKATYGISTAIQAADMVKERSKLAGTILTARTDTLYLLLPKDKEEHKLKEEYLLTDMQQMNEQERATFLKEHRTLDEKMLLDSWGPQKVASDEKKPKGGGGGTWTDTIKKSMGPGWRLGGG